MKITAWSAYPHEIYFQTEQIFYWFNRINQLYRMCIKTKAKVEKKQVNRARKYRVFENGNAMRKPVDHFSYRIIKQIIYVFIMVSQSSFGHKGNRIVYLRSFHPLSLQITFFMSFRSHRNRHFQLWFKEEIAFVWWLYANNVVLCEYV